jgi:glycosyltransferase involved in cell wall biosynthesis
MKLVYCLNSICTRGGIEMVTLTKANALAELPNYEVYIVVTDNTKPPVVPINPSVNLVDLKVNYYEDDWKARWHVLYGIFVKRILHKRRLARVLRQIAPDIVISVGTAEKNMLPSIRGKWKCIREFHYLRLYRTITSRSLFDKILAIGGDILDKFTLRNYDRIVVLTEEDKITNWKGYKNIEVIPNPIRPFFGNITKLTNNRIVTAGRLTSQKNYLSLIKTFSLITAKHPNWTLDIYGEGPQRQMLEQEVKKLELKNKVRLCGFAPNLPLAYSEASVFAFSSIYEGLPLVMIEAMSCGLPVVSYACPCGPHDIITEGKDGFLIPVNDEQQLADRICYLIEHEDIRRQMSLAAIEKSKQFSLDKIIARWQRLFNTLVNE